MKKISDWFFTSIFCLLLIFGFTYRVQIASTVMQYVVQNKKVLLPNTTENYNNYNFALVKETTDFHVKNRQNILDAIYTILNHGLDDFTFYCDQSYKTCSKDFDSISRDQTLLSTINNMVSPYNSYEKIYFTSNSYGKIEMKIDKLYSSDDVKKIEAKIKDFEASNINDSMSITDKIRTFHDYVINNSVYDKARAKAVENGQDIEGSQSHKATGPLIYGSALCSGYSDAMKIYLDKLKVPNYKVSNANHIWNLVYLNGQWLHLDLTWDDPVTSNGSNILLHKFFLISTDELKKLDSSTHTFNEKYYPEISH
jgi:transglutaminase/protease-like cytokinesis protein 3